jgi:GNAT superfamily N-acetyltransferase
MLAYSEGNPIAWCALGPRADYLGFLKSRVLKPIDTLDVWAIVCFFVHKAYRRKGLTLWFLQQAMAYARQRGATTLEAYPIDPKDTTSPDVFAWPGLFSTYLAAGFQGVARRSPTRPIVRYNFK